MDELEILLPRSAAEEVLRAGLGRREFGDRSDAVAVITLAFQAAATMVTVVVARNDLRSLAEAAVRSARERLSGDEALRITVTTATEADVLEADNSGEGARHLVDQLDAALNALGEWDR